MLSHDDSDRHPYWFARIIGLFHVVVHHSSSINPIELDVVWVRWYGCDPDPKYQSGWKSHLLPRVGFVEYTEDDLTQSSPTFGFVDPTHIILGVHLIPAFHHGVTNKLLPPSNTACLPSKGDVDFLLCEYVSFSILFSQIFKCSCTSAVLWTVTWLCGFGEEALVTKVHE